MEFDKLDLSAALHHAASQAALAPSIHNTQPWRFAISGPSLEIFVDGTRHLQVLDPLGRQLLISVGCAAFNARVALAALGWRVQVERFPDITRPELAYRITIVDAHLDWIPLGELAASIADRHTNRRQFEDDPVPAEVIAELIDAVAEEGAELMPVTRPEHRLALAALSQRADAIENADPGYRAELRRWTTDDPRRPDGVPAMSVPHVDTGSGDDLPIRDFDTHGMGWLPMRTHSALTQCLMLLNTRANRTVDWLRAGEALERLLLELTRRGYAAGPLTQVIEVQQTNRELRAELGLEHFPHILLRVGRAPAMPPVNRRPLSELLVTESQEAAQ
jgi:hypothetical protein